MKRSSDSPTNIRVSDLREQLENEVGRLMNDGNVKVKKSQINTMLKREIVDMMKLRFGSEVTSLLSGTMGFIQSRGKPSKTSGSGSVAQTQVNVQPGIIGRDLNVEQVDLDSDFDDIVIDLQDLDKMLYRADSQSTLQPPHDALISPDSPFKDAVSDRGLKNKEKKPKKRKMTTNSFVIGQFKGMSHLGLSQEIEDEDVPGNLSSGRFGATYDQPKSQRPEQTRPPLNKGS